MRGRIFSLAFALGFVVLFAVASVITYRLTAKTAPEEPPVAAEPVFEVRSAVFLLIFNGGETPGPFSLVALDGKAGRLPILSFSENTVFSYGDGEATAGELFGSLPIRGFCGAVEKELSVELSGYFLWDEESADAILAKTGTFDYVFPQKIRYKRDGRRVELSAGVQNMTAKKLADAVLCPDFSETQRCDLLSRLLAAFFERRLRRFLPESGDLFPTLLAATKTDLSALEKADYQDVLRVLAQKTPPVASSVTWDAEKEASGGRLWFTEESRERVKKYFSL